MISRETSLMAYRKLMSTGTLNQLETQVVLAVIEHAPITTGELWKWCFPDRQRSSISSRVAELKAAGILRELGTAKCRVTHETAYLIEYSNKETKPKVEKVDKIAEAILKERNECANLAAQSGTLEGFAISQLIRNRK